MSKVFHEGQLDIHQTLLIRETYLDCSVWPIMLNTEVCAEEQDETSYCCLIHGKAAPI